MLLNLSDIENDPSLLTFNILLPSGEKAVLRPLKHGDVKLLTKFLEGLSIQTRKFYTLDSYDLYTAKEMCDAINKYDKLRLVVVKQPTNKLIALFEYSFDITEKERKRFSKYNIELKSKTDCRIGPCISDKYQNCGIGSISFPYLIKIAHKFEQKRLFLWGGVFQNNKRAINYYEKNGFKRLGSFKNLKGEKSIDMIINLKEV